MARITWIFSIIFLAACAHSPEYLAKRTDLQLCSRYGSMKSNMFGKGEAPSLREEMERRNIFTPQEWELIDANKIEIGMSLCALKASWGESVRDNVTSTRYGSSVQHVYKCGVCSHPNAYVYTENGRVTAWQSR